METQPDIRERILLAAHHEFLTDGLRASMERVALGAGVAKQTLYNHFPSKQALFGEVVRTRVSTVLVALDGDVENPTKTLTEFALAYRQSALKAECIAALRNIAFEGARFPELCQGIYTEGTVETQKRLAHYLSLAMRQGSLRTDDALFAADMLIGMLVGVERMRLLFGIHESHDEAARVAAIVACFMRAYHPTA